MPGPPIDPTFIAAIADDLPVGIWVAKAPAGEFVYANRTFQAIMGLAARDDVAVGEYAAPYGIHTPDGAKYPENRLPFVRALETRALVTNDDIVIHRPDGVRVNVRAFGKPLFDAAGVITHVVIAFIDITREMESERARIEGEARIRHSQRMESIGNLAGGIAHDFNNLLASIKIIASYLKRTETDPQRLQSLEHIDQVTDSGAQLTQALLRFARPDRNLSQLLSLHEVVRAMAEITQRTIDRKIDVRCELEASTGEVVGDPSQLEQVVMNLVINARDAMPQGGVLTMRTYDHASDATRGNVPAGDWVALEVTDTGTGIDPALRERIFEPYFTTKHSGTVKGTGLGLATVYGIVQSHGGVVELSSTSERGTTMRLLFPAARPSQRKLVAAPLPKSVHLGVGTLLVIDDEPLVRAATAQALKTLGYSVMTAEDGPSGIAIFREHHGEIRAVVLDMVMPRMTGRETLRALREIDPAVQVLMTTGLSLDSEQMLMAARPSEEGTCSILAKPYDLAALSEAVAKVVARKQATRK